MAASTKTAEQSLEEYLNQQEIRSAAFKRDQEAALKKELKEQQVENARNEAREKKNAALQDELRRYKARIPFSRAVTEHICLRVSNGEMLEDICRDVTMPERGVVMQWLEDETHKEFHKEYEIACKRRLSVFEDQLISIADDSRNDYVERLNSKTGESFRVLDQEALSRSKMRLEMRLKHLKAYNPTRWGDNPDTAAALRDNAATKPPQVIINFLSAAPLPGDAAKVIDHMPGVTISQEASFSETNLTGKLKVG